MGQSLSRKNPPGYRLRALEAVDRIGRLTSPGEFCDLNTLCHDRNPKVRDAAGRLIFSGRLRVVPDAATG